MATKQTYRRDTKKEKGAKDMSKKTTDKTKTSKPAKKTHSKTEA